MVAVTVLQIGVAAAMVLSCCPRALRAVHLLVGTLIWAALVILAFHSGRTPAVVVEPDAESVVPPQQAGTVPRAVSPGRPGDAYQAAHHLPAAGDHHSPDVHHSGRTSIAIAGPLGDSRRLPDGGRGERDQHVVRPGHRREDELAPGCVPFPAGRIPATLGLAFGIGLGLPAFAVFWYRVNPLSAWLALGGLLFYVFVYTIWLKRSSPQNIVIGGAAGAFPPLVGWAAMTGRLDLAAIYLFAIIFYWTPPHFWALALIKRAEYAKAGVPMMPVVRGEERTKFEMLAYTLILLPLTLMPAFFGALGAFYGVAAALLGARLLWYCIRLLREQSINPTCLADVPLLPALPGSALRRHGRRSGAPVRPRTGPAPVLILDQPEQT